MGRNILFMSVFCLLIFETTAVQMCETQSSSSENVQLNLNTGAGVSGCNCRLTLTRTYNIGSDKPKMFFKVVNFTGCKYKLVVSYNNINSIIECSNNNTVFYDINKTDEIKLYLESTTSQDETTFEVKITSSVTGPFIKLDCFSTGTNQTKPTTDVKETSSVTKAVTTTETTTSTVTTTSPGPSLMSTLSSASNSTHKSTEKSTITPTSNSTHISTKKSTITPTPNSTHISTKKSTIAPTSNATHISTKKSTITSTPETFTYTVTQISSKPATGNAINEKKTEGATNPEGDDIDIGIIGGAVGGGLLLIILIIIIIICVVKKRKKNHEKRDYNRPTVTGSQHDYTDIDIVAKDNNSSSRQSDNMDQKANSPVVMEIIENDLYVSSDEIMNLKSCDNNNTNQKTDAIDSKSRDNNNTNQKTDANNGPAENSTSQDKDGPLYAAVNKKNKSFKSDQTDKSNGIAGYTDSDLEAKGNNSSSRQSDNTEQNTKSPVEIEMDPKSRDDNNTNKKTDAMDSKSRDDNNTNQKTDAMDPKSRDDNNTNQKTDAMDSKYTDANNCPAEMEIIENDLYVSSGEASNSRDNDGPLYSSVNKTPKSPISNQAGNSNGITGEDHDTLL